MMKRYLSILCVCILLLSTAACAYSGPRSGFYELYPDYSSDYDYPLDDAFNDNDYQDDDYYEDEDNNNNQSSKKTTAAKTKKTTVAKTKKTTTVKTQKTTKQETNSDSDIKIIAQSVCYDHYSYGNAVTLDSYNITDGKLFFSFTGKKYYGGSYDSFATDAIFFDGNNNVIDIRQVMHVSNFNNASIGQSFVDDERIPDGTKTILIKSNTKSDPTIVANQKGSSNITITCPSVCYDHYNYGNGVTINSYNIHDGYLYFVFTAKTYYGGGYDSFATDAVFYNSAGAIIDTEQIMHVSNFNDFSIGRVYYDDQKIPDGTTRIVIQSGTPSSNNQGGNTNDDEDYDDEEEEKPTPTTTKATTKATTKPTSDPTLWTYEEADTLKTHVHDATTYAGYAYNKTSDLFMIKNLQMKLAELKQAQSNIQTCKGYLQKALSLAQQNQSYSTASGTLVGDINACIAICDQILAMNLTTDNVASMEKEFCDLVGDLQVDAAVLDFVAEGMKFTFRNSH